MSYIGTTIDVDFNSPEEAIIVAMCESYIIDYFKALKRKQWEESDRILEQFRKSKWLSYVVEDTEQFIQRLFEEGEERYGKAYE